MSMGNMPEVVSRQDLLAARKNVLVKEQNLTQVRDQVNADARTKLHRLHSMFQP